MEGSGDSSSTPINHGQNDPPRCLKGGGEIRGLLLKDTPRHFRWTKTTTTPPPLPPGMNRKKSPGVRPRLGDLSAEEVIARALQDLGNLDSQLHRVKYEVQTRAWNDIGRSWRDLDLLYTLASLPIAELARRVKTLGRVPGRGRK